MSYPYIHEDYHMYIGKCNKSPEEMSNLPDDPNERDPIEELKEILHGTKPHIPEEILAKAKETMINEIMQKNQEIANDLAQLKLASAANK